MCQQGQQEVAHRLFHGKTIHIHWNVEREMGVAEKQVKREEEWA